MDAQPTLAIGPLPGLERRVHPLQSKRFWVIEIWLVLLCLVLRPVWTIWREGIRITGPITVVKEVSNRNEEWVTVRDPATELVYTTSMQGHDHEVGNRATVIVHPTDPSKVLTPTTVYLGVVALCALLVIMIAYPITAVVRHRRSRGV